ncbi:MAG TPA: non-heme iron oxygenase ferredoxin subunit [Anaerolineae bacterium]|nr:non-heme iron oxygenase ferredoxin subunit [Anaerolineae bacterium]
MGDFVAVAKTNEVEEGVVKVVRVGDTPIGLTKVEGEFFAFADVCTHDDGPVAEGELDEYIIACPRHGAKFDIRTGKVKQLPAVMPIPVYAVRVEGDVVLVSNKPTSTM